MLQYGTVLVTVPEYRTVGIPRTRTVLVRVLALRARTSTRTRVLGVPTSGATVGLSTLETLIK